MWGQHDAFPLSAGKVSFKHKSLISEMGSPLCSAQPAQLCTVAQSVFLCLPPPSPPCPNPSFVFCSEFAIPVPISSSLLPRVCSGGRQSSAPCHLILGWCTPAQHLLPCHQAWGTEPLPGIQGIFSSLGHGNTLSPLPHAIAQKAKTRTCP